MKKLLIPLLLIFSLSVLLLSCERHALNTHTIGIVKAASVVPTSYNESIKTQITCDSLYFVIKGLPTLIIGSKITGSYEGSKLVKIFDSNNNEFSVLN